ncbi:slipin family protein, partial [Streptomyces sp. NPDC005141]
LQTVVAVAAEKNSTLVLPFPVELLRFLERAQQPVAPAPSVDPRESAAPAAEPVPPLAGLRPEQPVQKQPPPGETPLDRTPEGR